MKKLITFFCLTAAIIALPACSESDVDDGYTRVPFELVSADGDTVDLQVEIADEPEELKAGLMHREVLAEKHGMLFVFQGEYPLKFWMKNTIIPLDVIYFNSNNEYVSHATMQPCTEDPCPDYLAKAPSQYALEVPAGSVETWNVGDGWKFVLQQ